jgi:hypothetical protein
MNNDDTGTMITMIHVYSELETTMRLHMTSRFRSFVAFAPLCHVLFHGTLQLPPVFEATCFVPCLVSGSAWFAPAPIHLSHFCHSIAPTVSHTTLPNNQLYSQIGLSFEYSFERRSEATFTL